jgi:hypothetical protein
MKALKSALLAAVLAMSAGASEARPPEVDRSFPGAQLVGEARYRILAWHVFDASLWTTSGAFSWSEPFALTLTYRRSFSARAIAERTIAEMSSRGAGETRALAPLRDRLEACFANVTPGDRITGVSTGPNSARFYFNGERRCEIEWPHFQRRFFGIWLDARGEARRLSVQLRGA